MHFAVGQPRRYFLLQPQTTVIDSWMVHYLEVGYTKSDREVTAEVFLNPSLDSISFVNLYKSKSASLPWKVFKSTSFICMKTPTFYNTEVNRIVDISQTPCPAMLDQQFSRPQVTYWSTGAATIPTTMTIGQGQTRLDQMSVKQTHLRWGGGGTLRYLLYF